MPLETKIPVPRAAAAAPPVCFLYFLLRYHSPAYFAGGAVVLAAFHLALYRWDAWGGRIGRAGPAVLIGLGIALPALGAWQFLHGLDLGDLDQTSYVTALWNFRHGNPHYAFQGLNMFGVHSQYTAFLWIPVQALGGALGLKLGKGACLIAAVWLMRRGLRGNPWGAWAGIALLLAPPVASQFFFGFHPEFIAAPVLVLALWAYREERLGAFLACTAFLAYSKEVFTLAIGGILIVALMEKRPWKWLVLPGALCCAQMFAYWYVVLPRFAPAGNYLGHYIPVTAGNILSSWLRPQSGFYLIHIFLPWLPLLATLPKRYLALPLPLMAFYTAFPDAMFLSMWPNYAFPLAFLCAGGLVLADSRSSGGRKGLDSLDGRILLACAVGSLLCYPLWREVFSVPRGLPAIHRDIRILQSAIPPEAPLLVNAPFTARLAARREVSVWGWRKQPLGHFAYVVVDGRFAPPWLVDPADLRRGLDSLADTAVWAREYGRESVTLYRRRAAPSGISAGADARAPAGAGN